MARHHVAPVLDLVAVANQRIDDACHVLAIHSRESPLLHRLAGPPPAQIERLVPSDVDGRGVYVGGEFAN